MDTVSPKLRPKCSYKPTPTKWPHDLLGAFDAEADRRTKRARVLKPDAPRVSRSAVIKERAEVGMILQVGFRIGLYNLLRIDQAMEGQSGTTIVELVIPTCERPNG